MPLSLARFTLFASLSALPVLSLYGARPVDIRELFPQADQPASLTFQGASNGRPEDGEYIIKDYEGNIVSQGRADANADSLFSIHATLPQGYYELFLKTDGNEDVTGIWSSHPVEDAPQDGFLSIDTAMSWLTRHESGQRPALVDNLRHIIGSGGMARERFHWHRIFRAEEGDADWETNSHYDSMRRLYADAGIPVLEMLHDVPAWMGRAQKGKFPDDLIAANRGWLEFIQRWSKTWGAIEVWNEPDHHAFAANQPADQYVPLVKAIRHAMTSSGLDTPIGGGVVAMMNAAYLSQSAHNGLLDECDFFSFHYYGNPLGLERLIGQHRAWMADAGYETKPLWITESGEYHVTQSGRRPADHIQRATAITYAMQAVEARACGVARLFPFVYVDYNERSGTRNFGMLDRQNSPLRMLAASAQAGRALAGMDYIGDIPIEHLPGVARARVFAPAEKNRTEDEDLLVVLYTGRPSKGATVALPFPVKEARGIDGRRLLLDADKKTAAVGDGMAYLRVRPSAIKGLLKTDTEAMRLWRLGRKQAPDLPPTATIVLQPQVDVNAVQAVTTRGYFLQPRQDRLTLSIGINNLSDKARTVMLRVNEAEKMPVFIPSRHREMVPVEVDISTLPTGPEGDSLFIPITATTDDGSRVGPAMLTLIPSLGENDMSTYLRKSGYHFALPVGEDYRWDRNANGKVTFEHQPPATWGFSVQFPPNVDRWAYPGFRIPQEVDQSRLTGVLVRARCLKPATVRLMTWDGDNVSHVTHFPIIPADGEWQVAYISLSSYIGALSNEPGAVRIARISIGLNSDRDDNALEIRDLYLLGE